MAGVDEAAQAKPPLGSDLAAGIQNLSAYEEVTFNRYVKLILPLDGYVFWVKSSILSPSALLNSTVFNAAQTTGNAPDPTKNQFVAGAVFNQPQLITPKNDSITCRGSFHYSTELRQEETEIFSVNRVVFTSLDEIDEFNRIGPTELYIAEYEGIRFAFSSHGNYYLQADTWHYQGAAVYSDMFPQIIDDPRVFDSKNIVVSNSLPFWLNLNNVNNQFPNPGCYPDWPIQPLYPTIKLFPSFLGEQNLTNHFGSVHIIPESTRPIQMRPTFGPTMTHNQLCEDTVRITLYGLRNFEALDFVDFVCQMTLDTGVVGLMDSPVIRDEKRGQPELQAIAQKKSVEFRVNYYQNRVNDLARQLIKHCVVSYYVNNKPIPA